MTDVAALKREIATLRDLYEHGTSRPRDQHVTWREGGADWRHLSTEELRDQVATLAAAMREAGILRGDRVGLLSRNSPRWAVVDWALVTTALVTTPIYPTLAPDQVRYIVDDSGMRGLFVEDGAQLERLAPALEGCDLEWIVVMNDEAVTHPLAHAFTSFVATGKGPVRAADVPTPADVASIIYTSGTTGRSKGVVLTHANLVSNALACEEAIDLSGVDHHDLSLLPLSHIFQRLVDYLLFLRGARMIYCPDPHEAATYLAAVKPTFFAAVPRIYEKVQQGMTKRLAGEPAWKQPLIAWSLATGRRRFHAGSAASRFVMPCCTFS